MSLPSDDASSLERLRSRLYNPNAKPSFSEPTLTHQEIPKEQGWQAPVAASPDPKKPGLSLSIKFLIGAVVFFVLAAGVAAYVLFFGTRSVSTNNIDISIQGPTAIASGDTVPLAITIKNNNPVDISGVTLSVDFPDGTRSPDDPNVPLARYTDSLDTIAAGQTGSRSVSAVLFGTENQKVSIPIRLEYKAPGSNSVFVKQATYDFTITTSPLSLSVAGVTQVPQGQSFTLTVSVKSNATTPIQNVAVLATYPFGFITSGTGSSTGPFFALGTLDAGAQKQFTITGTISGNDNDQRAFQFAAGTQADPSAKNLSVSYASAQTNITLAKPFLATALTIDRDTSETPIIRAGEPVNANLSWSNALQTPLQNASIIVTLKGTALDPSSIKATNGFFRSADNSVLFSRDTSAGLGNMNPGATGAGGITFATKPLSQISSLRNPTITITASVAGTRVGQANVPENLSATLTRVVKVSTDFALTSKIVRTTGPFTNTGPWPPVVDKETTYTVYFSLTNSVNSVGGATVTATLPSYVRFVGPTSPSDGSLTFNATTRTLTWNAGSIAAGTGYGTPTQQMAFQIALLPSASQKGTSPVLVPAQTLSGFDLFTRQNLSGSAPELTTVTTADPAYNKNDALVTQ